MNPNFELSNEERESVGLDVIPSHWERAIFKDTAAFFEGDTLRKFLKSDVDGYLEVDIALKTRDRSFLLPKTVRGKERKITSAVLAVTERANGQWFQASYIGTKGGASSLSCLNTRNMRKLDFWQADGLRDHESLRTYLRSHREALDAGQRQEIAEMKSAPRQQVKYAPGDIFRFRIDAHRYGFGLLLGGLKQFRKWGVLPEIHPWNHVMTVPLVVRPFDYVSTEREPALTQIVERALLPAQLMMDDDIFWGQFPVLGRKTLAPEDIDFPCGYGELPTRERQAYFYWGFGSQVIPSVIHDRYVDSGLGIGSLDRAPVLAAQAGDTPLRQWDLMHTANAAILKEKLAAIGYHGPLNYAAYARWADCLSPDAFIARAQPPATGAGQKK